jgi:hypothetical protein
LILPRCCVVRDHNSLPDRSGLRASFDWCWPHPNFIEVFDQTAVSGG